MARPGLLIRPEGLVPYREAFEAMHELAERRHLGELPDLLIELEHPPVYTAGRRAAPEHVVWSQAEIEAAGAELHQADRGGSVTFHGPGQLVGYPIIDLGPAPDVVRYLRDIEEVVIRAAADAGVTGLGRDPERTGVWAGPTKVCAIGVKLTHARVTLHGFALNCTTDLSWFTGIVPCGLHDRGVASLSGLAGRDITVTEMAPLVAGRFEEVFGLHLEPWPADRGELFAVSTA